MRLDIYISKIKLFFFNFNNNIFNFVVCIIYEIIKRILLFIKLCIKHFNLYKNI